MTGYIYRSGVQTAEDRLASAVTDTSLVSPSLDLPISSASLPTETLLAIFDYLFKIDGRRLSANPTLFPFSCALVCRRWHDVLCMQPIYWKRMAIALDSQQVSPSIVRDWANASRGMVNHLYVFYRHKVIMDVHAEHEHVDAILREIFPFAVSESILETISINVSYRSTSILAGLHLNHASLPSLRNLQLESFIADTADPIQLDALSCKYLSNIVLDSKSIVDLYSFSSAQSSPWASWKPRDPTLRTARYRPAFNVPAVSPTTFTDALVWLSDKGFKNLYIVDVGFDEENTDQTTSPPSSQVDFLHCEDIGGLYIAEHLTELRASTMVTLVRCTLSSPLPTFSAWSLSLEGITDPSDIYRAIKRWLGQSLIIRNCPAFDDEFLARMALFNDVYHERTTFRDSEGESDFLCPMMTNLYITGPCCSVAALRGLVDARAKIAGRRIQRLSVYKGSALDAEDRAWIQANSGFTWSESR
ncbi:hypothetical protein CONPUDRAFT_142892 [Coniophora puteana RWD-64-598 SS2]|uniref:F-box domain-containing protein n=1 Tax=Coniophora puteana (strain RWD-64-598) TaxID=741705 RepID=A0A5M3MUN5_CONPW|nr:uncharacterized protein CONPUDRAFT_142892 [Coniophora puteana RWD-64-598 SS2]EIW82707.1 hypothetical protein CONPUDRAFT_142892 [Coniophora puteana RWD-64-598 SS2]